MPVNRDLDPITLPMDLKFGQETSTEFINNLRALKVELVDAPSTAQARNVAWHYVKATWADDPNEVDPSIAPLSLKSKNLLDVLQFRALPTPMECLGFTFRLSGLSFQEVTHIIRHRAGSFAAQCTGDRDLRAVIGLVERRRHEKHVDAVLITGRRIPLRSLLCLPDLITVLENGWGSEFWGVWGGVAKKNLVLLG